VRLSIGLEHVDDLAEDILAALATAHTTGSSAATA
jgi:cystathionine beta-lyase/cystathionine gamma-synthase